MIKQELHHKIKNQTQRKTQRKNNSMKTTITIVFTYLRFRQISKQLKYYCTTNIACNICILDHYIFKVWRKLIICWMIVFEILNIFISISFLILQGMKKSNWNWWCQSLILQCILFSVGAKTVGDFFHTMRRQFTEEEWVYIKSGQTDRDMLGNFYRLWVNCDYLLNKANKM